MAQHGRWELGGRRVQKCLLVATFGAILLTAVGCVRREQADSAAGTPRRIISLSPSVTETLFALGLGDRVVAVTRYCTYPPEARRLPRVGGYLDPNYEQIMALRPDLVILRREQTTVVSFLTVNRIPYVLVDNDNVQGITDSFRRIAAACGVAARGDSLAQEVERELEPRRVSGTPPRILVCVGRSDMGSGRLAGVFAAGRGTYFRELVEAAGGVIVPDESGPAYPTLSVEAIMRLAPDIIVDIAPEVKAKDTLRVKQDWNLVGEVPAVKNGMVFCVIGSYAAVPGPRITVLLRDLRTFVNRWERECRVVTAGG